MSSFRVDKPATLIDFLGSKMPQMKRSTLKDRLRDGSVWVNGASTTKATTPLVVGDSVELRRDRPAPPPPGGVEILHVERDLVVINKPAGLLTVGTDKGGDDTVLSVVGPQLQGGSRLFPCHRLDRGTSGVLLLPRSPEVQQFYFAHWDEVTKIYVAVVAGRIEQDEGTITAPLFEQPGSLHVIVSSRPEAREAVTHWRVLQRGPRATLVELRIETGRKHQIRVHMQHLGHPVLGDDRYASAAGAPVRKVPRLCLHARALSFPHPKTGAALHFETAVPPLFGELVAG